MKEEKIIPPQVAALRKGSGQTLRRRAEEALKESEEKYRSLAASVDSMYLVDRDCAYLFMNEGIIKEGFYENIS